jgi:acyl-CoA synthetase (NDP forming)
MNYPDLDFIFHPGSVAVAGVTENIGKFNAGTLYVEGLVKFGFKGKIYPVGPGGGEVFGLKIYRSVKEIPEKVDYLISAIPARHTPQLVLDAAARGVRAIHFFTSGFGEIESSEGKHLQAEIIGLARRHGIRIIGPNCLGIYCPSGGMTFNPDLDTKKGTVSMISQSGGNASHCILEGMSRGVYFNKVVSMGNGADLNESDYLEYFAHDPETHIITAYIEGIKDGPRFIKALKAAASIKPVIIFKVGVSAEGAEAAASHTTALAGSAAVWDGLIRQAGAITANSIEEMIDVAETFLRMPAPAGRNAVVVGIGGGASVIIADEFSAAGINLPRFTSAARQAMMDVQGSEAGRIFKNPIDLNRPEHPDALLRTVETIQSHGDVDFFVMHVAFDHFGLVSASLKEMMVNLFVTSVTGLHGKINMPMAVILHSYPSPLSRKLAAETFDALTGSGIMVFHSIRRAAAALNKFLEYHERLNANR